MIVVYFSGTGNSEYCARSFIKEYNGSTNVYSIEQKETVKKIKDSREVVICYPVQFSNIPKILYDYITSHRDIWQNKRVFIIATMGLFSGDGAGILARLLKKYGAVIYGGLHIKMPDSICDEKALKRTFEKNKEIVKKAHFKIKNAVRNIKDEKVPESSEGKAKEKEKEILPATGEAANIAFLTLGFAAVFTALMLWFKHHLAQRK